MKQIILVIIASILSCHFIFAQNDILISSDSTKANSHEGNIISPKIKKSCINAVHGLLVWYKSIIESNIGEDVLKDETYQGKRILRIDSLACKKYLSQFEQSGFFSKDYLKCEWNKYLEADKELIRTQPQEGSLGIDVLDTDPILHYQDAIEYLRSLNKIKYSNFCNTGNNIFILDISIENVQWRFFLKNIDGHMLVDSIKPTN